MAEYACYLRLLLAVPDVAIVYCAGKMTLSEDVNLEEFVMAKDELSGADIKAVCTEAGLLALRERRMRVTQVCWPGVHTC